MREKGRRFSARCRLELPSAAYLPNETVAFTRHLLKIGPAGDIFILVAVEVAKMRKGGPVSGGDLLFSLWPLAEYIRRASESRGAGRRTGQGALTINRWKRLMDVLDR